MFVRMKKKRLPFFLISFASQRSFSVKRVRDMIKTRKREVQRSALVREHTEIISTEVDLLDIGGFFEFERSHA